MHLVLNCLELLVSVPEVCHILVPLFSTRGRRRVRRVRRGSMVEGREVEKVVTAAVEGVGVVGRRR